MFGVFIYCIMTMFGPMCGPVYLPVQQSQWLPANQATYQRPGGEQWVAPAHTTGQPLDTVWNQPVVVMPPCFFIAPGVSACP